ncbi:class II fructose-bisphosphate aldolase [Labrenzia sp. DG1229]|uniref:class II fructose-bisphosphate aldolase n=1 Tax=Labrenzia sp. DG1229 TaxID=681847 RepID=UPI00049010C1|nr:class II fructose-bisphosphate aldolase [Labrenzia sp. DG1229]
MPLITLRHLLDYAAEHGFGVPAFNISNMEQGLAIMNAAQACDAPVILQASLNVRRKYAGDRMIVSIVEALADMYPDNPICLHQDHGHDEQACVSAISAGFTSAMMDGSLMADGKTPASFAHNVDITARVAQIAHWTGASIEGELGVLGSLETGEAGEEDGSGATGKLEHDQLLTDPDQAAEFVAATQVDALAIACGTSHGAYKFTRKPDGEILAISQIEAIHNRIPDTHLVMHGSSSVPQHLQDLINASGGDMPQTWGVPVEEIERGIRYGVRKVNIDTDCRMAMSGAMRRFARENSKNFDPRAFIQAGMAELEALVRDRFERFGAAGHGRKIQPISLPDMARRYADGALDPRRVAA